MHYLYIAVSVPDVPTGEKAKSKQELSRNEHLAAVKHEGIKLYILLFLLLYCMYHLLSFYVFCPYMPLNYDFRIFHTSNNHVKTGFCQKYHFKCIHIAVATL